MPPLPLPLPEFVLLWLVLFGVVAAIMAVYLTVRTVRERRRAYWQRRLPPAETDFSLAGAVPRPDDKRPWPERLDRAFEQLIARTGTGLDAQQALGYVMLGGVTLAGVLLLWRDTLWLTAFGLAAGMATPLAVYLVLQARRRRQMQNQLPDTLYLVARSLRAGLSLEQALGNVAQHGLKPLAGEFHRGVEQMRLGLTVPAALQGMAGRIRLPDFDVFVTVVTLHRGIGGNLTMLLDRVANGVRDRNLFRGQVRAATALSRVTAFVLAAAAPVLFLGYAIWQPEFVGRFFEVGNGVRLLTTAAVLEVVGLVWLALLLQPRE